MSTPYLLGQVAAVLEQAEGQPMSGPRLHNYLAAPVTLLAAVSPVAQAWTPQQLDRLTVLLAGLPVSAPSRPLTVVEEAQATLGYHHERAALTAALVGTTAWAAEIGVTSSVARRYLNTGRVAGATQEGGDWRIPSGTPKPEGLPVGVKPGSRRRMGI